MAKNQYKWRLYADENIEAELVDHMRAAGFDVLSVVEDPELRKQKDDRFHYDHARLLRRYLLTRDMDFWSDHKFPLQQSPGVLILASAGLDVCRDVLRALKAIVADLTDESDSYDLQGLKLRMTDEGFTVRGIEQGTNRISVTNWKWRELLG